MPTCSIYRTVTPDPAESKHRRAVVVVVVVVNGRPRDRIHSAEYSMCVCVRVASVSWSRPSQRGLVLAPPCSLLLLQSLASIEMVESPRIAVD